MAEELSIDSLKDMKKADFIKAFKNKAAWKKAKSVIVMVDYKLDGKKTAVAIPFKKEAEMKKEMKRIKKEKTHPLKKVGGGHISFENNGEEGLKAKIELTMGALKPELLQVKAEDLFGRINAILEVLISADAELEEDETDEESPESESESDSDSDGAEVDDNSLLEEIENSIKDIQGGIKGKIQGIVDAIKNKKPEEDFYDVLEDISEKITDLKDNFNSAGESTKSKIKEKVDKIIAFTAKIAEIKNILDKLFKKGETPSELPDNVKKLIETLVNKIKEAKAVKKDPEKFNAIVKVIQTTFNALSEALDLLKADLAKKVKQSKPYQFIEDFIDSLDEEDDDDDNDENETEEDSLPDGVKKLIEKLVNKIKEAKAVQKDPKKFKEVVDVIETTFKALMAALELLSKKLTERIKKSKAYKFIVEFIESLDEASEEANDEDEDDENGGSQPDKVTAEEKKEFETTMKELEALFSAVGIQF